MKAVLRKLAARAQHKRYFHAVLVERGGAIVSCGYNHGHTHAEVMALRKLWPSKRVGTRVWSVRITPGGKLAMAKPCQACETFLRANHVKTVIYSTGAGSLARFRL